VRSQNLARRRPRGATRCCWPGRRRAGLALTPIFVTNSLLIEELSVGSPTAAAFSGTSTAVNGGVALAAPVAGLLVDGGGTDAAFLAGGAGLALGALAGLALPRPGPGRARSPEPLGDTGPLSEPRES
jgi:predicted MFS family arabinose efflux permease